MGEYAPPAETTTTEDSSVHVEVVDRDGQAEQAPVVDLPDVIADVDLGDVAPTDDRADDDRDVVDIG